jgi:hypothetical protein
MTVASNSHVLNGDRPAVPDFELRDEGTIVLLRPVTYRACVWCEHFVSMDSDAWDRGIVYARRDFQAILDSLDDNDLTVGPWLNWRGPE